MPLELYRYSVKLKFAPRFRTAGFGVFAGRAFEQDDLVPVSWKTLFLPKNIPKNQVLCNYAFGYNETHVGLVLDYGSVLNHHESANVQVGEEYPGGGVHFYVRMGFQSGNRDAPKKCCINACMHNRDTNALTLPRPQKTLRLDRKFWFGMAVQSGLKVKAYRTPMLTTRAQCGGRSSSRSHVAETFV